MTDFASTLELWYETHGRDLPWRNTKDPYRIWLSEIILQQTRVTQGYDYYLRFLKRFPTVEALGLATQDEVMLQWQGLGYYSRARNLHAAARSIVEAGVFPTTYEGVRALKGVGDYTAAAICSFAFDLPYAVVDGNVYRVLARVFGVKTPIDSTAGKKEFSLLAQSLLDCKRPALYNQAIMDFGAMVCTPKSPKCSECPLSELCEARAEGNIDQLPIKSKRVPTRTRFLTYIIILDEGHTFIRRRSEGDIWAGLYEPLIIERENEERDVAPIVGSAWHVAKSVEGLRHQLTHQTIVVDAYVVERIDGVQECVKEEDSLTKTVLEGGFLRVNVNNLDDYACSRLVQEVYRKLFDA